MDREQFARFEKVFHEVRELAPEERRAVARRRLNDDSRVIAEFEEYLSIYDEGTPPALTQGGAAYAPATHLQAGFEVGEYRVLEALGEGGFGVVYRALHVPLDREVALKVLPQGSADSGRALRRFHREASAGAQLRHPGIVPVFEVGECNGLHYLAMELVPGGRTLADRLWESRDRTRHDREHYRELARFFIRAAEACEHAHANGIVHRDLKPTNLLLGADGQPRLADFGIARIVGQEALSRSGDFRGTPFYASPEQVDGREADERSDVFSLGVTIYEALTTVRPFRGDTAQQVFRRILRDEPEPPERAGANVPWELSAICMKALEKNPRRRYSSMRALADDLGRFLAHEPIAARRPGPVTRSVKWSRRHPILSATSAVIAVTLPLILLALRRESLARELAEWRGAIANLRGAEALLQNGSVPEAIDRLGAVPETDQDWVWRHLTLRTDLASLELSVPGLEWVVSDGARRIGTHGPSRHLREWDCETGELLADHPPARAAGLPAAWHLSSDQVVGFDQASEGWLLWRASTGAVLRRLPAPSGRCDWAFSADGGTLAAAPSDGQVLVFDLIREEQPIVLELNERDGDVASSRRVRELTVSPNGARVAGAVGTRWLWIWDVATREAIAFESWLQTPGLAFSPDGDVLAVGSNRMPLRLVNAVTGELVRSSPTSTGARDVAFAPDGERILCSTTHSVEWLETSSLRRERLWARPLGVSRSLQFARGGATIVAGFLAAERVVVWDGLLHDGTVSVPNAFAFDAAFAADGSAAFLAASRGELQRIDLVHGTRSSSRDRSRKAATAVAADPAGRWVACGDNLGVLRVFDPRSLDLLRELRLRRLEDGGRPPSHAIWALCTDPRGRTLFAATNDGRVRLVDTESWTEVGALDVPEGRVASLVHHSRAGALLAATDRGRIHRISLETGRVAWSAEAEIFGAQRLAGLSLDPLARWFAAATNNGYACLWNLETGELEYELATHRSLTRTAFSPDGAVLLVAGQDGRLRFWDLEHPAERQTRAVLQGDEEVMRVAMFSPDGDRILTSGPSGTRIWESDKEAGRRLARNLFDDAAARGGVDDE